jgi:FdhD protein
VPRAIRRQSIRAFTGAVGKRRTDNVAVEEPLEIRIVAGRQRHSLAVTMRTPGNDFELAAGFALSEGIIRERAEIARISYCVGRGNPDAQQYNVVNVQLQSGHAFDPSRFTRNVYTTSSCGVCGKASLEQVRAALPLEKRIPPFRPSPDLLYSLPNRLREQQTVFASTGGLHATALFDSKGELLLASEDVGRHNAMDKLIGTLLLKGQLPMSDCVALVSGRASFELVQKVVMAGIPALAAIGAPSSLAIDLAKEFGVTLVGFLRDGRFNLYTETD